MKKNRLLIAIVCLFAAHNLSSQTYDGWYLSSGVGAQMLFSSDAENLNFKQRLTPSLSLSAGKWISPLWGLRLQAGAYSLNGYSTANGIYLADPLDNGLIYGPNDPVRNEVTIHPDGSYRHYLRYANIHADLQLSLFNLFGSRKHHKWDIIPAIGLGYFRTFAYKGTPVVNSISSNFSLMGKYAINKRVDINLEVSTAVLPDAFDGRIAGRTYENTLGVRIGLTYRFKGKSKPRKETPVVHCDTVEVERVVERRIVVTEPDSSNIARTPFRLSAIQFILAGERPLPGQEVQFENIANYLNNNPNAKIILEGYGDKETGSVEENLRISAVRAANVRKILTATYKVDVSRIEIKAVGASEQPYSKNALNRIVVVKATE